MALGNDAFENKVQVINCCHIFKVGGLCCLYNWRMNHNGRIPVYLLGHVLLISTVSIPLTFGEDFPSLVFLIIRTVYKMKEVSHFQG